MTTQGSRAFLDRKKGADHRTGTGTGAAAIAFGRYGAKAVHFDRSRQKAESIAEEGERRSGEAKLVQATSETRSNRARCSTGRSRRWAARRVNNRDAVPCGHTVGADGSDTQIRPSPPAGRCAVAILFFASTNTSRYIKAQIMHINGA